MYKVRNQWVLRKIADRTRKSEKGHMPEKENELVTSDLVLKALGVLCELGTEVPLTIDVGGKMHEKTYGGF